MGRAAELQRLREIVAGDHRRGVIVAGRAGVGKTRVARELVRLVERAGLATAQATGTRSASTLPFGALAPLLPARAHADGGVDDMAWLLQRSAAALVERAGERRLVLSVDDAHLLDDASATLVHHLAVTGSAFVLLTTRTGEPVPDAVVALWRDELAERVELAALPDAHVADLLTAALGGPVDAAAASELAARTQGNVLFLRELVMGARQTGVLREERGVWRLRGRLAPSDRLVELVESRLGDLEPPERALLELVAYGEPLGQAELTGLGDPALAESLERRALLRSETNGRRLTVRLAHPLYGEVLRAGVPAIRARDIARALAEAVEATGARRREDALRVASWRLTGGGGSAAVLLAGASEARWRYDFPLAERLVRAALDAGAGFDAALLAAQLALLLGRADEARCQLAQLARRASGEAERAAVAFARTDAAFWTGRDGRHIVDEALAAIEDPALRDALEAARAQLTISAEGPRAAADAAAPLLRRAEGPALVRACLVATFALGRLGRVDEALAIAERGRVAQLATPAALPWYPWYHDLQRCLTLQYAGRFHEAQELARARYEQALSDQSIEAQAMFDLVSAWGGSTERGYVRTAARRARQAIACGRELDRPVMVRLGLVYGALALALGGRAGEAQENLAALADLPTPLHDEVDLARARAWTAVAAGRLPEGRRQLERAAALGLRIGDLVGAAAALHGLARLGQPREVRHELADVARHIEGRLAPARVAHTDALARGDAAALDAVSQDFEAMGADLLAAEAAADAATVHRRADRPRAAAAAELRAGRLARRCEDPVTPALQGIAARAVLTPAERETALLAAAGLSNREIAGQIYLSVRTVENRLQRVYEKLGLGGRADLHQALDSLSEDGRPG